MKIIFFATPEYTLPILNSLEKAFKIKNNQSPIIAIVTQSPKPAGRKKMLSYSPIDTWAYKRKLPVFYQAQDIIGENIKADLGILAAFGQIIPKSVIEYFPQGILNIHPSLLPKYRGASPIQAAILTGETKTGVSIIKLDEKVDHGPIISQFQEEISATDTTASLRKRLFQKSKEVLITLIPAYLKGKITARKQEHKLASFTKRIKKKDGFIPPKYLETSLLGKTINKQWTIEFIKDYSPIPNAQCLESFIRAMNPWPISWTKIVQKAHAEQDPCLTGRQAALREKLKVQNTKKLKILKAHIEKTLVPRTPCLVPDIVQLEGKGPVSWKQFKQGYPEFEFAEI